MEGERKRKKDEKGIGMCNVHVPTPRIVNIMYCKQRLIKKTVFKKEIDLHVDNVSGFHILAVTKHYITFYHIKNIYYI